MMEEKFYKMELTKEQVEWVTKQEETELRILGLEEQLEACVKHNRGHSSFITRLLKIIGHDLDIMDVQEKIDFAIDHDIEKMIEDAVNRGVERKGDQ